jgi:2-enoate reductase
MKLFEKGTIGNLKLKNRIVMMPMAVDADPDGGFSEANVAYYAERAKGGVGLIITGYSAESDTYEVTTCTKLDNFQKIGRASEVVDACHAYGAKVCMQLGPGLGRIYFNDPKIPPYSASDDVSSYWNPDMKCKALTKQDIATIVKEVGREALIAKRAGADAVELDRKSVV